MSMMVVTGVAERVQDVRKAGNTDVLNFTVVENVTRGDKTFPVYVRCAVWGKQASAIAQQLGDGSMVSVIGEPQAKPYQSKDGEAKASLECNASQVQVLTPGAAASTRKSPSMSGVRRGGQQNIHAFGEDDDDSAPF